MNSSDTTRLLRDARDAMEPTEQDRERVFSLVSAAVTAPEVVKPGTVARGTGWTSRLRWLIPAVLLGSGAALWFGVDRGEKPAASPRSVSSVTVDSTGEAPEVSGPAPLTTVPAPVAIPVPAVPATTAAPVGKHRTVVPSETASLTTEDTLPAELKLIGQASAALNRRAGQEALEILDVHRQQFPRGVMTEERDGLYVIGLCQIGRMDTARHLHDRFVTHSPDSPMHIRISAACGF
jgi:hypothetical protein